MSREVQKMCSASVSVQSEARTQTRRERERSLGLAQAHCVPLKFIIPVIHELINKTQCLFCEAEEIYHNARPPRVL